MTPTTQHTPGPWEASEQGKGADFAYCIEPCIARVSGLGKAPMANARLLAAAPDLLAAIEAMLTHAEGTNTAFYGTGTNKALRAAFLGQKEIMQAARAAIAKAKGI